MAYGCKMLNNKNGKGNKGTPLKEYHKRKIGDSASKPVRCIETGIIYKSSVEAAKSVGLKSASGINGCCNGRGKSAKGYHWEFVNKEDK